MTIRVWWIAIASTCAVLASCKNAPPASSKAADPDQVVNGSGAPSGYIGRTDEASRSMADAKYTVGPDGKWEVHTGPAHIIYKATDTASGAYTLRTDIDQMEAPRHPEAYGVFFGGQNLTGPNQRYTYFLVRGNGMYAVKVRDGSDARTIVDFTASPNIPVADASGKASYAIRIQVAADSVHFLVNEKPVATVARGSLAADGIAGIRINHNLHVVVQPLSISR